MNWGNLQIDQFVHTLQYGDAISGEVLTIQNLLRSLGAQSEIYSLNTHHLLEGKSKPMETFSPNEGSGLIHHYSIASPQNTIFTEATACKRAIVYHNLTPSHWYQNYNHKVTSALIEGRTEIPSLIEQADICIADSSFNADELRNFGCTAPIVLPLTVDPKRWETAANPGIISALKSHGGSNILHVGRLAPNKCIEDILKAFYFYHHKFDPSSRLWIVGHDIDTELYSLELRSLARKLRIQEAVNFTGSVADCELQAFYQAADAYICMSEHEGFCVPLIEALHHQLPVIAYSSSAIPETLGASGVLLHDKDPLQTALLLREVIANKELQDTLNSTASQQLEKFSIQNFSSNLQQVIQKLFD